MFHKVYTLKCGGSEHGFCNFTIAVRRSELAHGLAQMAAHAADANHNLANMKKGRAFQIVED